MKMSSIFYYIRARGSQSFLILSALNVSVIYHGTLGQKTKITNNNKNTHLTVQFIKKIGPNTWKVLILCLSNLLPL